MPDQKPTSENGNKPPFEPVQVFPVPRRKRWYHPVTDRLRRHTSATSKPADGSTPPPPLRLLVIAIVIAALSGGLIGAGVSLGLDWAWKTGLGGLVLAGLFLFLVRSRERLLWALFFTFMAGAAGSLASPAYSIELFGAFSGSHGDAGGSGAFSSGGDYVVTLLWFAGAIISAAMARMERGR